MASPSELLAVQSSEAAAVAAIVRQAQTPTHFTARQGVVILPNGTKIDLENELLEAHPKRPRALVVLHETQSFIDYLQRFKRAESSIIFGIATEEGYQFRAIIDFHNAQANESGRANWGEHVCRLEMRTTPEWKRWLAANGKAMTQEQFAEFVEENAPDILVPDAALLLDMVEFLQGKRTVTFKSAKNLRNGTTELVYSEQIDEGAGRREDAARFPHAMVLKLFPFVGASGVEVNARLRFRVGENGRVTFSYLLDRPFKIIEGAFVAACSEIETATQIPVMLGDGAVSSVPSIR